VPGTSSIAANQPNQTKWVTTHALAEHDRPMEYRTNKLALDTAITAALTICTGRRATTIHH